jgi:hypothetical protein
MYTEPYNSDISQNKKEVLGMPSTDFSSHIEGNTNKSFTFE